MRIFNHGNNAVLPMIEDKKLINRIRLVLFKFIMEKMSWKKAIEKVLREVGRPMNSADIAKQIIKRGYYKSTKSDPDGQVINVNTNLYSNPGWFRKVDEDLWELVDKSVTTSHTPTAGLTVGRATPVVVRPSTVYDPYKKHASGFIDSKGLSVLSYEEKELLELIVNFRLPLVKEDVYVCFADILDYLEVEFNDNEEPRPQLIDVALLRRKLYELRKQIGNNAQSDSKLEEVCSMLQNYIGSANNEGKVDVPIRPLGEFIPGSNPKVVIYYKNIKSILRWPVMAGVFVHEMFHAWNYFNAGKMSKSVLAIDEPMVEFETLYFLKELAAFTSSQSHSLKDEVERVYEDRKYRVRNKQWSIGDVAAYGFGYYLFDKLSGVDSDSIDWIETYSVKSAFINGRDSRVGKATNALIPVYPFTSEAKVMKLFKKIIFDRCATSVTAGKSDAAKTGSDVSLRKLVLACIEIIGRKYFEAKELYAFAPIFKLCAALPGNLEDALIKQLDELVKEGVLEALPHDYYSMKLAGIEVKSMSPAPSPPTKSKGGYTRGASIPFAVEFPDGVIFADNKAVKTFIKSLQKIGLSNVQHVGIMIQGYNLVSDVERPSDGRNKWQDYVDNKYIYTKLANSLKIKYLYQIANELGISIKINYI